MIYIHADTECAVIFSEFHLVFYLLIIGIGLYDADCFRACIKNALEHVILHHADKV